MLKRKQPTIKYKGKSWFIIEPTPWVKEQIVRIYSVISSDDEMKIIVSGENLEDMGVHPIVIKES